MLMVRPPPPVCSCLGEKGNRQLIYYLYNRLFSFVSVSFSISSLFRNSFFSPALCTVTIAFAFFHQHTSLLLIFRYHKLFFSRHILRTILLHGMKSCPNSIYGTLPPHPRHVRHFLFFRRAYTW